MGLGVLEYKEIDLKVGFKVRSQCNYLTLGDTLTWVLGTVGLRATERDRGISQRVKVQVSKPEDRERRRNRAENSRKGLKLTRKSTS